MHARRILFYPAKENWTNWKWQKLTCRQVICDIRSLTTNPLRCLFQEHLSCPFFSRVRPGTMHRPFSELWFPGQPIFPSMCLLELFVSNPHTWDNWVFFSFSKQNFIPDSNPIFHLPILLPQPTTDPLSTFLCSVSCITLASLSRWFMVGFKWQEVLAGD